MRRSPLLSLALLSCTAGGSRGACDEPALADALARFEADPAADDAPLELLNAMSAACPALPGFSFYALGYSYAEPDVDRRLAVTLGFPYMAAKRMTCARTDAWAQAAALPGDRRAETVYELCELERLDLLEPGEPFLFEDFPGVVAQYWMVGNHVDPALARRVNRSLMFATAPEPLSWRRCREQPNSPACETVMRGHAGALPSAPGFVPLAGGAQVFLTPTWTTVAADDAWAPDADSLAIYADRQTRWGELIALMRRAHEQGVADFTLAVEDGHELWGVPVLSPPQWSYDRNILEYEAPALTIVIEADAVRVTADDRVPLTELDRLNGVARRLLEDDNRFSLRAGADVPVQTVVSVLDALRGPPCALDRDCVVLLPIVDLDPPTQRRPGDWSRLRVSLAEEQRETWYGREVLATQAQLTARVELALEPIRACLVESEGARFHMPERLALLFMPTPRSGRLGVGLFGDGHESLPTECIAAALGVHGMEVTGRTLSTVFASVDLRLDPPTD